MEPSISLDLGAGPPTPAGARSLDDLVDRLSALRAWAGEPSYAEIADRIRRDRAARGVPEGSQRIGRSTVWDLFRSGRNRLDTTLLIEVVRVLGIDASDAAAWRHAYAAIVGGVPTVRRLVAIGADLPAPDEAFAGRRELVDALVGAPAGSTSVLVGMAGVGKTQLALQAAAGIAAGATVYVPLGGGDRRQLPIRADALLHELLVHAGLTPRRVGALTPADQRDLWARWVAEHRALVVLDDAFDGDQLDGVVPPRHEGRIIVTSRRDLHLAGSEAIRVEPFGPSEAVEFLRGRGRKRARGGEAALVRIAELCGGVPLELAVARARIAEHPDWSADDHLRRFERQPVGRTLSAALTATTDALEPDLHMLFRRVALHPGTRIAAWSAAPLCDRPAAQAEALLDHLTALNLLARHEAPTGAWYTAHDLVREHAAELLHGADAHTAQVAAVARLCDTAQRLVDAASAAALPVSAERPDDPVDDPLVAALRHGDAARAWLGAEIHTLVDLIDLAVTFDLHERAGALALPVSRSLDVSGDWDLAVRTVERVLDNPDPAVRARSHRTIALVAIRQHRYDDAIVALQRALAVDLDDTGAVELAHTLLGGVYAGVGRLADALEQHQIAAAMADASGDPVRRGRAHGNLANRLRELGRMAEAERLLVESADLSVGADDAFGVMLRHGNLGLLYEDLQRDDEAVAHLSEAIRLGDLAGTKMMAPRANIMIGRIRGRQGEIAEARRLIEFGLEQARGIHGDAEIAEGEAQLGRLALRQGDAAAARTHFEATLAIALEGNDRLAHIDALNLLGEAATAAGDTARAIELHTEALGLADDSGFRIEIAKAHRGLAAAGLSGDTEAAATHRARAEALFADIGIPADD